MGTKPTFGARRPARAALGLAVRGEKGHHDQEEREEEGPLRGPVGAGDHGGLSLRAAARRLYVAGDLHRAAAGLRAADMRRRGRGAAVRAVRAPGRSAGALPGRSGRALAKRGGCGASAAVTGGPVELPLVRLLEKL